MNNIDKKKCADLIRETCDTIEKMRPTRDVMKKVEELRKYAETLWPKDRNPLSEMQYDELQKKLNWHGTPYEMERGLRKLKAKHDNTKKVAIAY